jgi:hypothetical protein
MVSERLRHFEVAGMKNSSHRMKRTNAWASLQTFATLPDALKFSVIAVLPLPFCRRLIFSSMRIIDFHTYVFPNHLAAGALETLKENVAGERACTDGPLTKARA